MTNPILRSASKPQNASVNIANPLSQQLVINQAKPGADPASSVFITFSLSGTNRQSGNEGKNRNSRENFHQFTFHTQELTERASPSNPPKWTTSSCSLVINPFSSRSSGCVVLRPVRSPDWKLFLRRRLMQRKAERTTKAQAAL